MAISQEQMKGPAEVRSIPINTVPDTYLVHLQKCCVLVPKEYATLWDMPMEKRHENTFYFRSHEKPSQPYADPRTLADLQKEGWELNDGVFHYRGMRVSDVHEEILGLSSVSLQNTKEPYHQGARINDLLEQIFGENKP